MSHRRLAIIPARGGSKRIPDKNIRDFCGKPMIAYSLEAAAASGLFEKIHVSTESLKIAKVAEGLGFPVDFLRPQELSDDHTPIMPVLKCVVETYKSQGLEFDQVCLIMACAPLIKAQDLVKASELSDRFGGKKSVLAVALYPVPVEWAFERSATGELSPVQPGAFAIRSQDLAPKYYDAGLFSFMPVAWVIQSDGSDCDQDFISYVLPRNKAIDIDEPEDLVLAEALYRMA